MVHTRGDISNPDTADNRENIVERGGGGEEVTGSQYDKGYDDSPNIIFFHIRIGSNSNLFYAENPFIDALGISSRML
jgi:hypothetical protein